MANARNDRGTGFGGDTAKEQKEEAPHSQDHILCGVCGKAWGQSLMVKCSNNGPMHLEGCHESCMPEGILERYKRDKIYHCSSCCSNSQGLLLSGPAAAATTRGSLKRRQQPGAAAAAAAAAAATAAAAAAAAGPAHKRLLLSGPAAATRGSMERRQQQQQRQRVASELLLQKHRLFLELPLRLLPPADLDLSQYNSPIGGLTQISCKVVQEGLPVSERGGAEAHMVLELTGRLKLCEPMEGLASEQQQRTFRNEVIQELRTLAPGENRKLLVGGIFCGHMHPSVMFFNTLAELGYRPLLYAPDGPSRRLIREWLTAQRRFIVVSQGRWLLVFLPTAAGELLLLHPCDEENKHEVVDEVVACMAAVMRDRGLAAIPPQLEAHAEQEQQGAQAQAQQQPQRSESVGSADGLAAVAPAPAAARAHAAHPAAAAPAPAIMMVMLQFIAALQQQAQVQQQVLQEPQVQEPHV